MPDTELSRGNMLAHNISTVKISAQTATENLIIIFQKTLEQNLNHYIYWPRPEGMVGQVWKF